MRPRASIWAPASWRSSSSATGARSTRSSPRWRCRSNTCRRTACESPRQGGYIMRYLFAVLALTPLAACASAPELEDGVRAVAVDGTVTYRQRIALPADATVVVQLLEV